MQLALKQETPRNFGKIHEVQKESEKQDVISVYLFCGEWEDVNVMLSISCMHSVGVKPVLMIWNVAAALLALTREAAVN